LRENPDAAQEDDVRELKSLLQTFIVAHLTTPQQNEAFNGPKTNKKLFSINFLLLILLFFFSLLEVNSIVHLKQPKPVHHALATYYENYLDQLMLNKVKNDFLSRLQKSYEK